jgi:uncharacterized protein (DUF433 family)
MDERNLLERITSDPKILGGKPVIRGRRLAVEHVLGMMAAGDSAEAILEAYPWLERDDIQACLLYAEKKGLVRPLREMRGSLRGIDTTVERDPDRV